ncbi:MAG TPA: hypothetical protein VFT26_06650, partial [Pyrinomonadaceae bacterium]|nr:hypothetical protein [Pyrinomonadaceae bacterium]
MSKVIISMLPELGHVNATLRLARSLNARGHEVYYLATADYEAYLKRQGLRFICLGETLTDSTDAPLRIMESLLDVRIHCQPLEPHLARIVQLFRDQIAALVGELEPDLFMIDPHTPEIALIAHELSVPYVFLNNVLFGPLEDTPLNDVAPYLLRVPEIILCPQEFDFPEQVGRGNRKRYYVGAEVDLQRHEEPFDWSRIDAEKPLIYCSFGSQSELYPN